jgi:hypothetical protein
MAFMMSKSAYLFDAGDHNGPHAMIFTSLEDGKDGGVAVAQWSDGTVAPVHQE